MQGSADGTGAAARFSDPTSVAVDSAGNVAPHRLPGDAQRRLVQGDAVLALHGGSALVVSTILCP